MVGAGTTAPTPVLGTPKRKLHYLAGGPPVYTLRPRVQRRRLRPEPRSWGGPTSVRSVGLSVVAHAAGYVLLWVLLLLGVAKWIASPSGERGALLAQLEARPEPPAEPPSEPEREVSAEAPFEDPQLVEGRYPLPLEPEPAPLPAPSRWAAPEDPFTLVTDATFKRPAPREPEPEPEPVVEETPAPAKPEALAPVDAPPEPVVAKVGEVEAPEAVEHPEPVYPKRALRLRQEGRVMLSIDVDAAGLVRRVALIESSGHDLLDEAAIEAFYRWRFAPRRAGEPDVRRFKKPFRFALD
jgi:protein TonB